MAQLPRVALAFFDIWFGGKPFDSTQRLVGVNATDDTLILEFEEGETLEVRAPQGFEAHPRRPTRDTPAIGIRFAHHVRWSWYYYGRPRTPENRYHVSFAWSPEGVEVATNADFVPFPQRADPAALAVALY